MFKKHFKNASKTLLLKKALLIIAKFAVAKFIARPGSAWIVMIRTKKSKLKVMHQTKFHFCSQFTTLEELLCYS